MTFPDENANAIRCVDLVRGKHEIVDVTRIFSSTHIHRTVRHQLGRVHQQLRAHAVCLLRNGADVVDVPGHIRRAGDRHEAHFVAPETELVLEVGHIEAALFVDADMLHPADFAPRQLVRVVFHQCRQDDITGTDIQTVGELVDRLGRILGEDHDVIVETRLHKLRDHIARALEHPRRQLGLKSGPPMHVGIPVEELVDLVGNRPEGRRRGRIVEVDVFDLLAAQDRDLGVDTDELIPYVQCRRSCRIRMFCRLNCFRHDHTSQLPHNIPL